SPELAVSQRRAAAVCGTNGVEGRRGTLPSAGSGNDRKFLILMALKSKYKIVDRVSITYSLVPMSLFPIHFSLLFYLHLKKHNFTY
ncbi:hypothetical protein JW960_19830, partial [candidate division KSB1 bacterium]|nr:hypothetical protein [candidate division KSB1 bacterium]